MASFESDTLDTYPSSLFVKATIATKNEARLAKCACCDTERLIGRACVEHILIVRPRILISAFDLFVMHTSFLQFHPILFNTARTACIPMRGRE